MPHPSCLIEKGEPEMGRRGWRTVGFWLTCVLVIGLARSASAEDLVWATGQVVDPQGKPLSNALIAVYDDGNKVVDFAKTDGNGEYALAVPRRVLHLDKKHSSFLTEVFTGLTRFVGGA